MKLFNLADYEPVEVRLEKFIKDYPDFRISTELEVVEATRYIVKAYLFKTHADSIAWATGYAEETVSQRGVNQTSALENCETSAIGRALANAGYAPKGKRPSREEMSKVVTQGVTKPLPNAPKPLPKPVVQDLVQVIKAADAEPAEKDYWTTPFGEQDEMLKKVDAPVTMDQAVATVAEILIDEKMPVFCEHGQMQWKDGNKNGRAWGGYFCPSAGSTAQRCPTQWYVLASNGTWEPQKARV